MGLGGRDVAVVGAGIGGLAAALALAQRGARVRVHEQAPALTEVGAGLQLSPNGVAVLEALGLGPAVAGVASVPQAVELRDAVRGRMVARLPLGRAAEARYGRPYWHVHRSDLLAVLAEAAGAAGVELRLGCRLEASALGGAGADVVVAADGVRSATRTALFGGGAPRFAGHVAWRATVAAARLPAALVPDGAVVRMAPGRHLVAYPLRGRSLVNLVAVEERVDWTAEGWMHPDDPRRLRAAFSGCGDAVAALLAPVEACFLWGLFDHPPLPGWVAGPVALLGDACHPMLPFLAQGAAMALEDAWTLAACLDRAERPEAGLAAYEARRKARAERVQRAAAASGRVYHLGPGLRGPAHLGLRTVAGLAPGLLARRFDWLFGYDATLA